MGPQSAAQNAAEATMANVDSPGHLAKEQWLENLPDDNFNGEDDRNRHERQTPSLADGSRDDDRKHG